MNKVVNRVRVVMAMVALAAVAVIAYSAMPSAPARAQTVGGAFVFKTAGPVALNHSESALIGLLLPAVQRADKPFHVQLFDSMGNLFVDIPVAGMGGGALQTAFYNISFSPDNVLRVTEHSTGRLLASQANSDGILTGLLVPAVRPTGRMMGGVSASIQVFDAMKQRGQVIQMCDGSV